MVGEPAALQVHPRQAERTLGVATGDAHELVVDAEAAAYFATRAATSGGQRSQHELAEDHVVHDPLAVVLVVRGEHLRELLGPERLEVVVVDVDAGEDARDRLEQARLDLGQPASRGATAVAMPRAVRTTSSGSCGAGPGPIPGVGSAVTPNVPPRGELRNAHSRAGSRTAPSASPVRAVGGGRARSSPSGGRSGPGQPPRSARGCRRPPGPRRGGSGTPW